MEAEDLIDTNVALAVAATAAAFSKPVRRVLHRGAVLGVSGVLVATDAVSSFGRGVRRGLNGNGEAVVGEDAPAPAKKGAKKSSKEKGDG